MKDEIVDKDKLMFRIVTKENRTSLRLKGRFLSEPTIILFRSHPVSSFEEYSKSSRSSLIATNAKQ